MINHRLIIALFICTVFVCGAQIAFADPVSAASYKKFDSGTIKTDEGMIIKYTSYIKGKNSIYMKLTQDKTTVGKIYIDKGKTKVKYTIKSQGQKTQTFSARHFGKSTKTLYNQFKKDLGGPSK